MDLERDGWSACSTVSDEHLKPIFDFLTKEILPALAGQLCYFLGVWCLMVQIVAYVLMQEDNSIRIPIAILTGFIAIPLCIEAIPKRCFGSG